MTAPTDKEFKSFIDRVLRLKEEQDSIGEDIKGVYAEMKQRGYDKTAAGTFVGELRKKEKNPGKFEEGNAILDLYRDAYNRASGTVVATHTHAPDREALAERRKRNFSESMDDTKALSAEAVALGLIDPEAHAETARIADALAVKFGNGPLPQHDPETGEIQESRPTALYLAAEREGDGSLGTNPVCYQEPGDDVVRDDGAVHEVGRAEGSQTRLPSDRAENKTVGTSVIAGEKFESPAYSAGDDGHPSIPSSDALVAGQGGVAAPSVTRAKSEQAVDDFDPSKITFLKPAKPLRPHCQNREVCAGVGYKHCYSCQKAAGLQEAAS